jgi:AraC-like DNA-binding protein
MLTGEQRHLAESPMHSHPAHMFVIYFTDTTTLVMPKNRYRSEPGHVVYLPPDAPHHMVNEARTPYDVAIFIHPAFMRAQAEVYQEYPLRLDQWSVFPSPKELLPAMKRFIGESKKRQTGFLPMQQALGMEVVHLLLRSMLGVEESHCGHFGRTEINRSIEYMWHNLSEKLTVDMLADSAGMSVPHFNRVFRQETGASPINYLIEIRLEMSCRLILSGGLSLKEIAMDCGFASLSHFSSSFQRKFHIPPSFYLMGYSLISQFILSVIDIIDMIDMTLF